MQDLLRAILKFLLDLLRRLFGQPISVPSTAELPTLTPLAQYQPTINDQPETFTTLDFTLNGFRGQVNYKNQEQGQDFHLDIYSVQRNAVEEYIRTVKVAFVGTSISMPGKQTPTKTAIQYMFEALAEKSHMTLEAVATMPLKNIAESLHMTVDELLPEVWAIAKQHISDSQAKGDLTQEEASVLNRETESILGMWLQQAKGGIDENKLVRVALDWTNKPDSPYQILFKIDPTLAKNQATAYYWQANHAAVVVTDSFGSTFGVLSRATIDTPGVYYWLSGVSGSGSCFDNPGARFNYCFRIVGTGESNIYTVDGTRPGF